jgi:excisionase family DNA binding protein
MVSVFPKKPQPLHTVSEVAEILNVSEKTVRRLIDGGHLQAIDVRGLVRVTPADLAGFISDHRRH